MWPSLSLPPSAILPLQSLPHSLSDPPLVTKSVVGPPSPQKRVVDVQLPHLVTKSVVGPPSPQKRVVVVVRLSSVVQVWYTKTVRGPNLWIC